MNTKYIKQLIEFRYDTSELNKTIDRERIAHYLIDIFAEKGCSWEHGSTRVTAIGEKFVYKIPRTYSGIRANIGEAKYYKMAEKRFPVAACRLIYLDKENLLPILVMEKVKPIGSNALKPNWAEHYVDGGQVGYNRKGEIVAYDL